MTIHAASKHIYQMLIAISLISLLASCGGGGSSGPKKDSTPNAFSFTPVTNAAVSTDVTSAPVTVSGFNQSVSISVSGGTYSIGGGAFASTAGTITSGQVVTVKVKSSDKTNTAVSATLTVGGVSGAFTVTTAPDVTPDTFSFTDAQNVGANSVNTSNEITVAGIDVAVPISITNGEYSINGGAYTNAAGTVSKDQKVTVRATASDQAATDVIAVLTIGGATGNYKVTTYADSSAPTAQILFPPPVSMTEGNTILVRGSASDEFSAIASVKVNGVAATPKAAGDFSSWQVSVPLTATSDNDVVVTTEDAVGNKSTNAAKVMVRQGDDKSAFPDANVGLLGPQAVVIDKLDGRNRLLVSNTSGFKDEVVGIDLATGERSLFASEVQLFALTIDVGTKRLYGIDNDQLVYLDLATAAKHDVVFFNDVPLIQSLIVDDSSVVSKIIVAGSYVPQIYTHEISSSTYSLFSSAISGIPNAENPLVDPRAIVFDRKNDRYLVANGGQSSDVSTRAIIAVNKTSGARTILSSNSVGTGELFTAQLPEFNNNINFISAIVVDEGNNRAIVSEDLTGTFFTIDLSNGNRKVFSDSSQTNAINSINFVTSLALVESGAYIFAVDMNNNGVYAVDIVTGERVVFSKSAHE